MLDILFISRLIPKHMDSEVRSKMMNTMDDAAIAWQNHIISGIEQNTNTPVKLLNFLPVRAYPGHYKDIYIKRSAFSHTTGADDINLPFLNLVLVKRLFQGVSMKAEARKWARENSGKSKSVIIYTLYPEFLKAAACIKKIDPDIKVSAVVLDLPEYSILTNNMGLLNKLYLKWSKKKVDKLIGCIDAFAFLTEEMRYPLGVENKPYCIIEGIYSDEFTDGHSENENIVMYAGTLHERFGVMKLVKAFESIKNDDMKLVICGYGDSEDAIKEAALRDKRIVFKGQLKRSDVIELMQNASAIVNPRENKEAFTKYSFPSKNLEALSSGVPFVGYKLDGIPDEYDEFINYPADDSEDALAECILAVCRDENGYYGKKAKLAKEWVHQNKNCKKQAEKLLNLILESNSEQ